jgi:cathepsin L
MRRELFEQRRIDADHHNARTDRTWTAGVNKLWDWTDAELRTLRGWDGSKQPNGGGMRTIQPHSQNAFLQQRDIGGDVPTEKVWSELAMAKRVKNQENCGSCWAIATSSVLEAHTEIYTGKVRTFSAQQIVECTPNPRHCGGDGGCQGATAELGMDWVLKNGCSEESEVPYTGQDAACEGSSATASMAQLFDSGASFMQGSSFGMVGWETLPKNEYAPLKQALAERGPVAVSVAADKWFNYESGIFNGCGKDNVIDHAVTAIGYGEQDGNKYWLIQNSWGSDWGESGHIRLQRHEEDSYCGMNNDPQKGVACQGETEPVPVCGMCGVLFDSVVPHFQSSK